MKSLSILKNLGSKTVKDVLQIPTLLTHVMANFGKGDVSNLTALPTVSIGKPRNATSWIEPISNAK